MPCQCSTLKCGSQEYDTACYSAAYYTATHDQMQQLQLQLHHQQQLHQYLHSHTGKLSNHVNHVYASTTPLPPRPNHGSTLSNHHTE